MRFALYKEVLKRERRKKRKLNNGDATGVKGDDDDESDEESDEEEDEEAPKRMSAPPAPAKGKEVPQATQDPIWGDSSQDVQMDIEQPPVAEPTNDGGVRPERCVVLILFTVGTDTELTDPIFVLSQVTNVPHEIGTPLCDATPRRRANILDRLIADDQRRTDNRCALRYSGSHRDLSDHDGCQRDNDQRRDCV